MDGYKDYFTGWIEDKDEKYKSLRNMYKEADVCFDSRFDAKEKKESPDLKESFERLLKELKENWLNYQDGGELQRMAHLTKGNILLSEGQYRGEHFYDPQNRYQQTRSSIRMPKSRE